MMNRARSNGSWPRPHSGHIRTVLTTRRSQHASTANDLKEQLWQAQNPAADRLSVADPKIRHQHMFHLHLTAMNSLLKRAHAHLEESRWAELAPVLEHLRVLYDGATATMHYTADFDPGQYTRLIRPSMAPPS
jgi:hypothetical protein